MNQFEQYKRLIKLGFALILVALLERVLKGNGYRACFVIEQECVWRNAGEFLAYQKPLFPSYVIADTDTPEEFFLALKRVPPQTVV